MRVSPGRPSSVLRPVGLALAALVAILLAILVASPDARTAVADRLGLRGAGIFFIPAVPTATPVTGTPTPGARLDLGSRVTLAEARARVAYPVHVPALPDLGDPDEVYYVSVIPGGQVAFIYLPRPGLPAAAETGVAVLLTQFRGDTERDFILKGLGPGSRLEPVTVNGGSGYWIEGMPHLFLYRAADGQVHNETLRLAGNTLLWEQDGLLFRLESALSKDEALRIAGSVN